jgi:ketosteroid isomerase-like protein
MEMNIGETSKSGGTTAMGSATPEEFESVFKAAYESRDASQVGALYESGALYLQPGVEHVIVGRDAIEKAVAETFQFLSDIALTFDEPELMEVVGDYAYCHGSSTTEFSLPDGTRHSAKSRSTTVLHRGDDGLWRLVIDHAS